DGVTALAGGLHDARCGGLDALLPGGLDTGGGPLDGGLDPRCRPVLALVSERLRDLARLVRGVLGGLAELVRGDLVLASHVSPHALNPRGSAGCRSLAQPMSSCWPTHTASRSEERRVGKG